MQVQYFIRDTVWGRTLTAAQNISKDQTIWQYDQKVPTKSLTLEEIQQLPTPEQKMFTKYCWQVSNNPARWEGVTENPESDPLNFIDHSCEPNMVFQGDNCLVAARDIKKYEPLTIEYATCDTVFAALQKCMCGTPRCRGRVTAEDARDPEIRKRYAGKMRSCIAQLR